jgi:multiple sugar transport system substrate-binding protein
MKRKMVSVLLALVVTVSMAACGNKEDSTSDSADSDAATTEDAKEDDKADESSGGETVKIQFMHQQVEQERQDVVAGLIEKFQSENPGIEIEQIPVNEDDYDSKIVALGGSGELPALIEYSQDQAKTSVTNQFTNTAAVDEVIKAKGEDQFFDGALDVIKTEDGSSYVGVPFFGWVQGIWVNEAMLKEKGLALPTNWEEVLEVAKAFHDPANKKYGIAIPTGDSAFTEQAFSQFAISNNANVFDSEGKVTFNTPEMKEAVDFYKELAGYTMPGSTEVADVNDAFVAKNAPMAIYSTYLLNAVDEAGFINDLRLVLPNKAQETAYGAVIVLGIAEGMEEAETDAAKKFASFMLEDENNIEWLHMAPGGVQPILKAVSGSEAYEANEAIQKFAHLSESIGSAFDNLRLFGSVEGKNFMSMGDITNTGYISKAINNIVVQDADIDAEMEKAQSEIEAIIK